MVVRALVRVQLCRCRTGKHSGCCEGGTHLQVSIEAFQRVIKEDIRVIVRSSQRPKNLAATWPL